METRLHEDARRFINLIRADIVKNASANSGIASGLARLDEVMAADTFAVKPVEAGSTAGFKWVDAGAAILENTRPEMADAIKPVKGHLCWHANASYPEDRFPPGYFDDWAFTQIIGPGGLFTADDLMMGMFAMGPGIFYPRHNHAAPELYYPLIGTHKWQRSNGPWSEKSAPEMIWHDAFEVHATETGSEAFLSVWLWSEDTDQWPVLV